MPVVFCDGLKFSGLVWTIKLLPSKHKRPACGPVVDKLSKSKMGPQGHKINTLYCTVRGSSDSCLCDAPGEWLEKLNSICSLR